MSENSELFAEIPDGWQINRLTDLSTLQSGGTPSKQRPDYWQGSVPWASPKDMKRPYLLDAEDHISEEGLADGSRRVPAGSLFIVIRGMILARDIPIALAQVPMAFNQDMKAIVPNGQVDSEFLLFALTQFRGQLRAEVGSSAHGTKRIGTSAIEALRVPVPPLNEQRAIAHALRTVQRAKEAAEAVVEAARQLKRSLLRHLFTYGPVPFEQADSVRLKETETECVPAHWQPKRLDEVATLQRGQDLTRDAFQEGIVPVIGATSTIGYHNEANVKGPGVTVVRSGSSAGKPLYIESDFWAHNVVLYVKDFHGNIPKFVYYRLLTAELTQYRAGVAVPTLNRNTFSNVMVGIPPLPEQLEIIGLLDAVDRKANIEESRVEALDALFKTLLRDLMTGRVRVHDLDLSIPEKAGHKAADRADRKRGNSADD